MSEAAQRVEIDPLWDFDRPDESETRFRALLPAVAASGDAAAEVELLTQIARAEGLQGRFADAEATLARAVILLETAGQRARVRWLLERGRIENSAGRAAAAVPFFRDAWEAARAAGEDNLAVDAAHMLGIAASPAEQVAWHERAIALAEGSPDPAARDWLGALLNNYGWTLHDAGRYTEALARFEQALAWREARGEQRAVWIARWCVARCLRSLGRVTEALALQERLRDDLAAAGEHDPYVDEEIAECLRPPDRPSGSADDRLLDHATSGEIR